MGPPDRQQHTTLEGHQGWVNAVCTVTVDGRDLLATGSDDQTVRLWDPATGRQHAILEGHQGPVKAVCAVTVGGRDLLASGGVDQTVRLWDPATGQQHAVLKGHQGRVTRCARSPWAAGACSPPAATTGRCGYGTPPPGSSTPPWKATRAGSMRCAPSP